MTAFVGISAISDSAAALVVDGKVMAAAQEERYAAPGCRAIHLHAARSRTEGATS
jgi:predicted NodU family carbamoyl transferase